MDNQKAAFPIAEYAEEGMTLRDYFAAKAMQGMFDYWDENPNLGFEHIASCSYDMADAMIKAREA